MTRMTLDPKKPKKGATDWRALGAKSDAAVEQAARADPDARPLSDAELARLRRAPDVKAIRERLGMTQREFARTFRIALGTVRDWEQGRSLPEGPASVLLAVIDGDPRAVIEALRSDPEAYRAAEEPERSAGGLREPDRDPD